MGEEHLYYSVNNDKLVTKLNNDDNIGFKKSVTMYMSLNIFHQIDTNSKFIFGKNQ